MSHTVAIVADAQIPFHDERSLDAVYSYLRALKPDEVIINGDWLDFPGLTTKFARSAASINNLSNELDEGRYTLGELRTAVGRNASMTYLEGNHEFRVSTLVNERADGLSSLLDHELSMPNLLGLDKLRIEYRPGWRDGTAFWQRDGLTVLHGNYHGAAAARRHWEMYGSCVFSHVHKPMVFGLGNISGPHKAISTGCLCNVSGPNMPPRGGTTAQTDWLQGIVVVRFAPSGIYNMFEVGINDHTLIGLDGKEYR